MNLQKAFVESLRNSVARAADGEALAKEIDEIVDVFDLKPTGRTLANDDGEPA